MSDELAALVYQTALGNQRAFEQLYRATSAQLFGVALALLRRRELAEEVVQEAYVKAWYAAGTYQAERGSVGAWLGTIARRSAIDRLRRHRDAADHTAELPVENIDAPVPGPLEAVLADADARRLSGCLEQLDERQSQSLAMAFMHGYTHSELAQRLQAPLGTIKAWLRRGLEKLRTCLEVARRMNYQQPELQQLLAGEYVLGTLHGAARRRFERLLVAEPALQRYAQAWERRLQPWLAAVPAVQAPDRVWQGIRVRLGHAAADGNTRTGAPWRWFGIGSAALAVALAALLVLRPPAPAPVQPAPVYRDIAVLNSEQAEPVWIVRSDADNRRLVLSSLQPVAVPGDRDLELWAIPAGGAPLSLGLLVIQPDGTALLTLSNQGRARRAQGAVLAISLEPRGGSPTGSPTGPVLYTGKLRV